uniref:Glutamate--cysteine ligase n=1 Tax=Amphimedon queenslandica TaxID=400682 RepID=A0A1X7UMB8_AMPQE
MGLLSKGKPLSWEETKKNAWKVHKVGIQQFISLFHKLKDRKGDTLKWGDEVEYSLISIDDEKKVAKLSLLSSQILEVLQKPQLDDPLHHKAKWTPEYASYVVEGTPGASPYGGCYSDFNVVEANMKLRREMLYEALKGTSVFPLTLTAFPRMGCPGFTEPEFLPQPATSKSRSLFYPDEAVSSHPRFITLTRNVRERRGEKPAINMPIFKDKATPSPFVEVVPNDDGTASTYGKPDHIYLDCMGLGMGCACLQVTFQGCDLNETRHLYDQLSVMCPIMLALTAAAPILRGYLADVDCRWPIISGAVDDRTQEERGLKPLKDDKWVIPKSRYDSIDMYLANPEYNDKEVPINELAYQTLTENGVDELMARHVAHLFIRDPISLFAEKLEQDVENESDHFENIQSTNWQSMRFKPPPPNSPIGWRVEFRPMDLQITDFENAAFVVFIVLVTRAILSFKLNFLIPISKMEDNMKRAINRDAARQGLFYFRKSLLPEDDEDDEGKETPPTGATPTAPQSHKHEYTLMSIDTIINGKDEFPGVIPLVRMYVNSIDIDVDTRCTVMQYLRFISKRASGELPTAATWMRQFVLSHPDYKHDSVVSEIINYDLISKIRDISEGRSPCNELTGRLTSRADSLRPSLPRRISVRSDSKDGND